MKLDCMDKPVVGEAGEMVPSKGKAKLTLKRVKEIAGSEEPSTRSPVKCLKFDDDATANPSTDCKAKSRRTSPIVGNGDCNARMEVVQILKKYLKYAFTIIVKRRKLCPAEAFRTTRAFGVQVPRFAHPGSLEYVEEVAEKVVLFVNRGSSEGCAIHVMIEKAKTLHVVQRFIFRTMGTLEPVKNESGEIEGAIDLEEVKRNCRESLLRLLNADTIRPMIAPQYSRWSLSIGIKKELTEAINMEELWANDPSGNYFPWKKRFRSLANLPKCDRKSEGDCSIPSEESTSESTPANAASDSVANGQGTPDPQQTLNHDDSAIHTDNPSSVNGDLLDDDDDGEAGKVFCFPLTSFAITSNFLISVYGLEYPAPPHPPPQPVPVPYISSIASPSPSPRINRSSNISHIRNIRQRLLRQIK